MNKLEKLEFLRLSAINNLDELSNNLHNFVECGILNNEEYQIDLVKRNISIFIGRLSTDLDKARS